MNKKHATYQPLTKKELKAFFEPYRQTFSDWEVEHDVVLARKQGPLRQTIYIEGLRYAAYRPGHSVRLLINIPDGCDLLHQFLDGKNRQVERREHPTKWSLVLKAMEEQFLPSIRLPLNVAETLRLAEEEARQDGFDNINSLTGLAVLNAYLENPERAVYWCGRVEETAANLERPLGDWETRKRQYALDLKQAIKIGEERKFLS